ncbi:MAG: DUF904 domain-containing protein [Pseudomonadota bacterium]|nr:DUF904 domain-containing protein [Pseudomonadota bacterium]
MTKLDVLFEKVDRLVLRHHELQRTHLLVEQQLAAMTAERDGLRARLAAARARVDALLVRLPPDPKDGPPDAEDGSGGVHKRNAA